MGAGYFCFIAAEIYHQSPCFHFHRGKTVERWQWFHPVVGELSTAAVYAVNMTNGLLLFLPAGYIESRAKSRLLLSQSE